MSREIDEVKQQVAIANRTLDELGLAENTLVMFSSDNGPEVPTDGRSRLSTEELAHRRYASSNGSLHNVSCRVDTEYLPPPFPKPLEERSVVASHFNDQALPFWPSTPRGFQVAKDLSAEDLAKRPGR